MFGQELFISQRTIFLDGVETAVRSYELGVNDAFGNPQVMSIEQYILNIEGIELIFTFASNRPVFSTARQEFAAIAESYKQLQ